LLYIADTNNVTIPDFQLQASAGALGNTLLSDKFPLNPSPGEVGRTVPLPDFTVVTPPGNVRVNEPLTFAFRVSAAGQQANRYDPDVAGSVRPLRPDGPGPAALL